jgi:hypothetical protein
MVLKNTIRIENPRLYPGGIEDQLQAALTGGANLQASELRINLYDVATETRTYFIYISPVSGDVTLIATWAQKRPSAGADPNEQGPLWRRITAHFLAA